MEQSWQQIIQALLPCYNYSNILQKSWQEAKVTVHLSYSYEKVTLIAGGVMDLGLHISIFLKSSHNCNTISFNK